MRRVRVFLSSPGDVRDERAIALDVLDQLRYDEELRGRADFEVIAWDRGGSGTPILATRTPQASIDEGLPRPSECDIVAVILWSRMGTPLPHPEYSKDSGEPYHSGTEWEFEEALRGAQASGSPAVLLYRRLPMAPLDPDEHDADERWGQAQLVKEFFRQHRDSRTGAIRRGHKTYRASEDFRREFGADVKALARRLVQQPVAPVDAVPAPLWQGSPFPGLRAFTPHDAPIYFGRGRETDELLARLAESRFLAVVGASGSGKSSLVGAGLLPRLAAGALPGVPDWLLPVHDPATNQWNGLRFTPGELGDNPFLALAVKLAPLVAGVPRELAADLERAPDRLAGHLGRALVGRREGSAALIFVDQFEELFATVAEPHVEPFIALLEEISAAPNARVVLTMRSDFYHRCVAVPALAGLLERGQFPLSAPGGTLFEMIMRPAERAGMDFEEGLAGRILDDTGRDPGALPLLAYTLDELYRTRGDTSTLSHAAYQRLGGVRGAIGTRAEDVFLNRLDEATRATFSQVFRELVEIDELGLLARRRVGLAQVAVDEPTRRFVDVFTEARLLVRSGEPGRAPIVFVAHEALFGSWTRLREWIELIQDDLRLLRRVRAAAREWDENGRAEIYRWQHERLEPVYETVERLNPALDDVLAAFVEPEYERLLPTLCDPSVEGYRRQAIMDRLAAIGAPTVPGLLHAIRSHDAVVRISAAATLARLGEAAVPGLVTAAGARDPEVRLAALGALRQIDCSGVVPALAKGLRDGDERVRSLATGALAAMSGEDAAAALAQATTDADLDVRWRAVGALGAFGALAIDPLLLSLHDEDLRVRTDALAALEVIGRTNPYPLLDALRHPEAGIRAAASEVLAEIGPAATEGLVHALDDEDPDVRWRAAVAIRGGESAVPALLSKLTDDYPAVRQAAVEALGGVGGEDGVPILAMALGDKDIEVAETAARALSSIARRRPLLPGEAVPKEPGGWGSSEPAVPVLVAMLHSDRRVVRIRAAAALADAGPDGIDGLVSVMDSDRDSVWMPAVDALARCGRPALPALLDVVRVGPAAVRERAAIALRAMGDLAVRDLVELARSPEPEVRRAVAESLRGSAHSRARTTLARLLRDGDPATRSAAAQSLGRLGSLAIPVLLRILEEPDAAVRTAAGHALRIVGEPAVPDLLQLVHGDDPDLRGLATAVLADIGTPAAVFGLSELGLLPAMD
ncbi:nSTAND1 domain-containing NTPase [Amycolatopsis sp. NPDC003731]